MKPYLAALAALTLLRLVMIAVVPLAPDETYYWVWSRALASGYPDHPPMVALWIRVGTSLAGGGPFGIRLLGPLSVALGSVMLADAANRLVPGRNAGLFAASLLNATLFVGAGSVIMTPDTPLLFFWTCTLWALARWLDSRNPVWWLVIGLAAGFAMTSKYTAIFLWCGIALWLLITPSLRPELLRPMPWLGAALGIAVFLPVVSWNAERGWVSFIRQGGRVAAWYPERALRYFGELIGAQIGLATPLIFLISAAGIVIAVRLAWLRRDPTWTLLATLTLLPIIVFIEHTLSDRVQGNWPAIIYPTAAIAAAGLDGAFWSRLRRPAVLLGLIITLLAYVQASAAPIRLSPRFDPSALRLAGWGMMANEVEVIRQREGATFVASDQYGVAAELAYALPASATVIGTEPRWSLFNLPHPNLAGQTGIFVSSVRRGDDIDATPWANVEEVGEVKRERDGVIIEAFRVYRVIGRADVPTVVTLPRPRSGN